MSAPLRFGLVGCGRIGALADDRAATWPAELRRLWLPYAHASAIVATPDAELVAVCDAIPAAAESARARIGAARAYHDHREMFARESLDVVAVATRTAERPGIILDAIAAGVRGIYCEKPIAISLEEATAVVEAVERAQVAFAYGTRRRFMASYLEARAQVRAGAIGKLESITLKFARGGLMWNHPHSVDMAAFFADDAAPTWARADLEETGLVVDGSLVDCDPVVDVGQIAFANGVRATVLPVGGQDVELVGTEGILTIAADGARTSLRKLDAKRGDIAWLLDETRLDGAAGDETSGTVRALSEIVATIRGERPRSPAAASSLVGLQVLFGWVQSHLDGGRRVALPLAPSGMRVTGRVGDKLT